MRAIKPALLWILGVAAVLLGFTPGSGVPPSPAPAQRQAALAGGPATQAAAKPGPVCAGVATSAASPASSGRTAEPAPYGECPSRTTGSPSITGVDDAFVPATAPQGTLRRLRSSRAPPGPLGA